MVIADRITERLANIDDETFIEVVAISDMFVDLSYQREPGPGQLGRMRDEGYNPRKVGIITLSLRADGRYAILDGNHRVALARHAGVRSLVAKVFIDLTRDEEAELFEGLNVTKPPTALDRWKSRLSRNEHTAVAIRNVLAGAGFVIGKIGKGSHEGTVSCIVSVERLYHERGPGELREVFEILKSAWDLDPTAYNGKMIDGMRTFWARYREVADRQRLISQLSLVKPHKLIRDAGGSTGALESLPSAIGKEIRLAYRGKSARWALPEWEPTVTNIASSYTNSRGRKLVRAHQQAQ